MSAGPEALLERARKRADLSDLGPDGWQEGFERMVAAIPTDLGGDAAAVERIEAIIVDRLVNRLRVEAWYAEHAAEAAAHAPEVSLVVIGTGRSGTTATHYLLAVDPQFRCLRKWEIENPVPPPDLATEHQDPRRRSAVKTGVLHIASVDGPTEDRKIHELSFHDDGGPLALPSYSRWWRDADHTAAFPYHERILRFLHSHRPPYRWLLKSPDYLNNLPPLAAYYPSARFVMTHRDPTLVIPSACSVIAEHTRQRLPDWTFEPGEFGRSVLERLGEAARRAMAARAVIGEDRFIDIGQPELQADPIGVAERIYDFAGLDLEDSVRHAMAQWASENRAGSRGQHRYAAAEFGLTPEQIRQAFAEYLDQYGRYCAPQD
jgi:hypothetical protein